MVNDLEQVFGVLRHHQPRCIGRKAAPSSLVIRGTVQLASAIEEYANSYIYLHISVKAS
ncbi:hypothetical protein [Nostoc sp. MG11]|uniref:hypothetical protein n=1 Tax=Nostoc sp. MG11 TaxID=2721166 RepID=UPI0018693D2C|nr:hypothetical protein [Nostoc sp. MG11]